MTSRTRNATIAALLVAAISACSGGTAGPATTTRPVEPAASDGVPIPTSSGPARNVAQGIVIDEQGDPVTGAELRLSGYTEQGGSHDDDIVSGADGRYRIEVPHGLYEIHGRATVAFDGGDYVFELGPVDGECEQQDSADGVVEDFVLALSGIAGCFDSVDPDNPGFYAGATVELAYAGQELPGDAEVSVTLTPAGLLADGGSGETLEFTRTVNELGSTFGPVETTRYLHDIPLGRYTIAGRATLPDGTTRVMAFDAGEGPAAELEFGFEPVLMEPYGIRIRRIDLVPGG